MAEVRKRVGGFSATDAVKDLVAHWDPSGLLEDVEPGMKRAAICLLSLGALAGFGRLRILEGRRGLDEQRRIYGRGRTAAECKAANVPTAYAMPEEAQRTWCRPEDSKHVQGRAVDLNVNVYPAATLEQLGAIARSIGLTWGGDWEVRDYGHFEV